MPKGKTKPKVRKKIVDYGVKAGMWAIFRMSNTCTKAHFTSVHDTREDAVNEARRLASAHITQNGVMEFKMIMVQIDKYCGLEGGKLVDNLEQ